MRSGNKIDVRIWGVMTLVVLSLGACRKELPNQPTPQPKNERYRVSVLLLTPEEIVKKQRGPEFYGSVEVDRVVLSGSFGTKEKGQKATVTIQPKEGYVLNGVYFAYEKGKYPVDQFPTTPDRAIKGKNNIEVSVQGDLKVIAILDEKHYEQLPYAKNVHVNEAYWKEQNQKAWNLIYPKLRKDKDYKWFQEQLLDAYPALKNSMKSNIIYRGEPNIMAWNIGNREDERGKSFPKEQCYQVAYALANKASGELLEIYPPVWWIGCDGAVGTVVFPTIPEGEYQIRLLMSFPYMHDEWYDVPLLDFLAFHWDQRVVDGLNNGFKFEDLFLPGRKQYEQFASLDYEDLYFTEEIRDIKVEERNSPDKLPIPRWRKARCFMRGERRIFYRPFLTMGIPDRVFITLSNGCNQGMRGTVQAVWLQNHHMTKNLEVIDHYQEVIKKAMYSNVGEYPYPMALRKAEDLIGEIQVELAPNEDSREISLSLNRKATKIRDKRMIDGANEGVDGHVVFYWKPEGSNERFFMQQANHHGLNLQEKSSYAFDAWWSYSNPQQNPQLEKQKELFDEWQEFGNRI